MLHCDSGGCFEEDQLCNFEQNCEDGSDEKNCCKCHWIWASTSLKRKDCHFDSFDVMLSAVYLTVFNAVFYCKPLTETILKFQRRIWQTIALHHVRACHIQDITWTNLDLLSIESWELISVKFGIKVQWFSYKKMNWKSPRWWKLYRSMQCDMFREKILVL